MATSPNSSDPDIVIVVVGVVVDVAAIKKMAASSARMLAAKRPSLQRVHAKSRALRSQRTLVPPPSLNKELRCRRYFSARCPRCGARHCYSVHSHSSQWVESEARCHLLFSIKLHEIQKHGPVALKPRPWSSASPEITLAV